MKRLTVLLLGLVLSAVHSLPAAAQEGQQVQMAVKVAIIDIEEIMRRALVVKSIRDQHNAFRTDFQDTIQKEEEELRNANQELARKRSLLSPEAFDEERRKFEQRLMDVQRKVQERKLDLEKAQNDGLMKVQETLNKIVVDVASQEELTLIFNTSQLVFWAKPLEITPIVLKMLDERMPSIKLETPKKKAG